METMEFEGKTTEEAINNASTYLKIPVEDLDIDIIEPGSAGIFGLVGTKKARIRVSYNRSNQQEDEATLISGEESLLAEEAEEWEEEEEEDVEEPSLPDTETEQPQPGSRTSIGAGSSPLVAEPSTGDDEERELARAKESLEKILELIPMEATVTARRTDGNISLNIEGDNSGLLIGRRGKTLDAIQFIVNKIVNKDLDKKVRVVVDSERYRQRRKDSLTQLALRMGEKAKRIGKPVTTNPMNPGDRRTVHMALRDDQDLDTRSRGEGLMKKVVIIPKK